MSSESEYEQKQFWENQKLISMRDQFGWNSKTYKISETIKNNGSLWIFDEYGNIKQVKNEK